MSLHHSFSATQAASGHHKERLAIGNLISPPQQPPYDNFPEETPSPKLPLLQTRKHAILKAHSQALCSPPISPEIPLEEAPALIADSPLIPAARLFPGILTAFEDAFEQEAEKTIDRHIAARKASPLPKGVELPNRKDYSVALSFFQRILKNRESRLEHLRRERQWLKEDALARKNGEAQHNVAQRSPKATLARPIKAKPPVPVSSGTIVARPSTVISGLGPQHKAKVAKPASSRPRVSRPSRPAKPAKPHSGDTPPTEKRKPAKADKDFASLPDYSPPLNTLTATNVLKTPLIGNPREFDDHDKQLLHLLHPDERQVAANLRLDVATYLTSKRRIFIEKLHFLYDKKKDFRKTHAQVACRIDVNKASKLHTAFDEVGWLNDKWFVNQPRPTVQNN